VILFLKVDLERQEGGPAQAAEAVMDAIEQEIDGSWITVVDERHIAESDYIVHVTAIGTSMKTMQESAKRRADQKALAK
jgi:hypothetical protein